MSEIWKPVRGYEDVYAVSSTGRVKRIAGGQGAQDGLILTPQMNRFGYMQVGLNRDNKKTMFRVHRLVMAAFSNDIGDQVNHKNGIRHDNRLENLEWCTHAENVRHGFRVTKNHTHVGENHPGARMNAQSVAELRRRFDGGERLCDLAEMFGLTHSGASQIAHRRTWRHI